MRWSQRVGLIFAIFIFIFLIKMVMYYEVICDLEDGKRLVSTPQNKATKLKRFDHEQPSVKFSDLLLDEGECKFEKGKMNCPDVRHLGDTVLRQTQLALVRMLYIFDKICRRHDIKYWMARGSLLGAVRHEGMIPWDNDLDIGMLKEDYEKFRLHSHELPFDMFLQNRSSDKAYQYPKNAFAKLKDNNGCYGYCARAGCKHHDGLQADMFVFKVDDQNLLEEYSSMKGLYLRDVIPLKELKFEGFQVFVPNRYKYVLEKKYGDFMAYPAKRGRCPTDGLVGIPWASCDGIESMSAPSKKRLLDASVLKIYRRYFWQ